MGSILDQSAWFLIDFSRSMHPVMMIMETMTNKAWKKRLLNDTEFMTYSDL